ncbi:MAG TPA: carbonic anhydrase [Candidatus Bathyarchaeia archaeon]|nr:carbonic anhydrase [Candidatus Bathyarchaeia archaeon]
MHECEAAIITCEDYRLHQRKDGRNYVAEFILSHGVDCDLITRAGGVQDLLRPGGAGFADSVIRDGDVSHRLHKVELILLLNHENCGAYAGFGFKVRDDELGRHHRDIRRTLRMLHLLFPKKRLIGSFAELVPGDSDNFQKATKIGEYRPRAKKMVFI